MGLYVTAMKGTLSICMTPETNGMRDQWSSDARGKEATHSLEETRDQWNSGADIHE